MLARSRLALRFMGALLLLLLLGSAPVVQAATTTQTVGPGGTVSTGSTVSADDPIQMTLTTPDGGTISIDKSTGATRPTRASGSPEEDSGTFGFFGPTFRVARGMPGEASVSKVVLLIDSSQVPAQWNGKHKEKNLLYCLTSSSTAGQSKYGFRGSHCGSTSTLTSGGPSEYRSEQLPSGDVLLTFDSLTDFFSSNGGVTVDIGHPNFGVKLGYYKGDTLGQVLRNGLRIGGSSLNESTLSATATVSAAVARKLRLPSRVIAKGTGRPGRAPAYASLLTFLPLTSAARTALKGVDSVAITVVITATGPDTAPGKKVSSPIHATLKR
jgi:hypothetical protein